MICHLLFSEGNHLPHTRKIQFKMYYYFGQVWSVYLNDHKINPNSYQGCTSLYIFLVRFTHIRVIEIDRKIRSYRSNKLHKMSLDCILTESWYKNQYLSGTQIYVGKQTEEKSNVIDFEYIISK